MFLPNVFKWYQTFILTGCREYLYISVYIWYDEDSFTQIKWSNADEVTLRAVLEMLFIYSCMWLEANITGNAVSGAGQQYFNQNNVRGNTAGEKSQKQPVTAWWLGFGPFQIRIRQWFSKASHWAAAHTACPTGAQTERGLEMRGGAGNTNTISARSVSPAANHRPQDKCSYLNVGRN